MSRRSSRERALRRRPRPLRRPPSDPSADARYAAACALAENGEHLTAQKEFEAILSRERRIESRAVLESDLGVLAAATGDLAEARRRFQAALGLDAGCTVAREN